MCHVTEIAHELCRLYMTSFLLSTCKLQPATAQTFDLSKATNKRFPGEIPVQAYVALRAPSVSENSVRSIYPKSIGLLTNLVSCDCCISELVDLMKLCYTEWIKNIANILYALTLSNIIRF